jgi:hypothetical protein
MSDLSKLEKKRKIILEKRDKIVSEIKLLKLKNKEKELKKKQKELEKLVKKENIFV